MAKALNLLFLALFFPITLEAGPLLRMKKSCPIFEVSGPSREICQMEKGQRLQYLGRGRGGFIKVTSDECDGYVKKSCVRRIRRRRRRRPAGISRLEEKEKTEIEKSSRIQLGISAGLDGLAATAAGSDKGPKGLGIVFGLHAVFPLSEKFRLQFGLSYEKLRLTRIVQGTTTGITSNPDQFTVREDNKYLGTSVILSLLALEEKEAKLTAWFDGGFDFLLPFDGTKSLFTQPATGGSETLFSSQPSKSNSSLLLFTLGLSFELPASDSFTVAARARFIINSTGKDGSRVFGIRSGLALRLIL